MGRGGHEGGRSVLQEPPHPFPCPLALLVGLGCPQEPAFLCPGAPPRLRAHWEAQHGTGRDSSPGGPCVGVLPRLRIRAISDPLRQALRKHTSPPYSCPLFEVPSVCASVAGSLSPGMGLALDRGGGYHPRASPGNSSQRTPRDENIPSAPSAGMLQSASCGEQCALAHMSPYHVELECN